MDLPTRNEISAKYRFDLTTVFETPDEWKVARADLREKLEKRDSLASEPPETPKNSEKSFLRCRSVTGFDRN